MDKSFDLLRVSLKIPQWEDMSFIRRLWSDPTTMAQVGGPVILTDEQADQWFRRMTDPANQTDCYRLIVNECGELIGEVSSHRLDRTTMTGEFNVKIIHSQRGKGYAKEAMRLFLDHFFGEYGGRIINDGVALNNRSGQEALLKFGFQHDSSEKEVFVLRMTRQRYYDLYGK